MNQFEQNSVEVNFDGLVGLTHNYAGLSDGNMASVNNANQASSPKQAALQGLKKMKALHDRGVIQGVLAPHQRPDVCVLRKLGFSGSHADVLNKAYKASPALLASVYSASAMWTANAATVSPSADTGDGKVHITPANLVNKLHRSIEAPTTSAILRAVFSDDSVFQHHSALHSSEYLGDEGAANHTRLCDSYGENGLEIFAFGRSALNAKIAKPQIYPARQTLEASQAIARLHQLEQDKCIFVQQNPDVIDKGVFHNDVIAVGNKNVLFYHQESYLDTEDLHQQIKQKYPGNELFLIEVASEQISVLESVQTYLFNSQLVSIDDQSMTLIAPTQCQEHARVNDYLQSLIASDNPINDVVYFDLNESMKNGGGPACLRLRVALTQSELHAVNPNCIMSDALYDTLVGWVNKHYRDSLQPDDLRDPALIIESYQALDELSRILHLGNVYPFQQMVV